MRNLSIIILNYKGWKDSIDCLLSLSEQTYKDFHIILIDNGSNDESYNKISSWLIEESIYVYKEYVYDGQQELQISNNVDLFLIKSKENHGFAKGNNIGIKFGEKLNTENCFLLNNDTVLNKNAIENLVSFNLKNPQYSALTPQIRYYEPNDEIWNCGGYIYPFATRKYLYPREKIERVPQQGHKTITLLTGCALFFNPRKCGILTEKFFFGEEDFEFSLRMRKEKKKMAVVFDSIIYHKVGASRGESKKAIEGVYIHYLNRFIDLKSYYSYPIWVLYVLVNSSYGFLMVNIRYKPGIGQSLKLFKKIFKDSKRLDGVSKQLFQSVFFEKKLII